MCLRKKHIRGLRNVTSYAGPTAHHAVWPTKLINGHAAGFSHAVTFTHENQCKIPNAFIFPREFKNSSVWDRLVPVVHDSWYYNAFKVR